MRKLIALVVVGSIFAALAAFLGSAQSGEDDLSVAITEMVQTSR